MFILENITHGNAPFNNQDFYFFFSKHELLEKRNGYRIHFSRCDTDPYWQATTLHLRKEVITTDIFENMSS